MQMKETPPTWWRIDEDMKLTLNWKGENGFIDACRHAFEKRNVWVCGFGEQMCVCVCVCQFVSVKVCWWDVD